MKYDIAKPAVLPYLSSQKTQNVPIFSSKRPKNVLNTPRSDVFSRSRQHISVTEFQYSDSYWKKNEEHNGQSGGEKRCLNR